MVGDAAATAPFALLCVVERLGATTIPLIMPSESTAVVRVEAVLRAPESLGDLTGAEITVQLITPAKPRERLVLMADGWMYGESIAVREVARAQPDATEGIRAQFVREREEAPVRHLGERARGAEVVVLGVVGELRPISRSGEWVPSSEHDPDWWVAVIAVEHVAKGGRPPNDQVEAVYANSMDVQWAAAPKPAPRQDGVFLLRRAERSELPSDALVLLDPADVQPREHYDEIRRLLEGD
jgi:hypothetical protein